jgi:formylglycine-generating enzyme required for sulfatase activity/WD40 repeat protein
MNSTLRSDDPSEANRRQKREYWCFISYRHSDNKAPGRQWGTWLHRALETYDVPADLVGTRNEHGDLLPERIFPVFRDEEELPADSELTRPIKAALQSSRFLVVVCSPQAVQSRFVAEEILYFKQLGNQDRILAAIIEGEPNASDDPARGGSKRECFPQPLRFVMDAQGQLTSERTEPIAADFRLADGAQGWTSPGAYRDALKAAGLRDRQIAISVDDYSAQQNLMLLKIVAGVLGVPLGVLTQRDKAYQLEKQKQRSKVLRRWLVAVAALGLLAMALGWRATLSNRRAVAAEADALTQRDRALNTLALSYHDRALALARTDWRQAMTYTAAALRLQPKSLLHSSLAFSLLTRHMAEAPVAVPLEGQRYFKVVFDPQGSRALACLTTGAPAVIDLATGKRQEPFLPSGSLGVCLGGMLSADGGTLLVDAREAFRWRRETDLHAFPARGVLMFAQNPAWNGGRFTAAAVQQEMANVMTGDNGSEMRRDVQLLDLESGARTEFMEHQDEVVAVLPISGERFLTIGNDKSLMLLDAKAGRHTPLPDGLPDTPRFAVVSASGRMAAVAQDSRVTLIDVDSGFKQRELLSMRDDVKVKSLAFSGNAEHLAVGFDGPGERSLMRVWHVPTGEPVGAWVQIEDKVKQLAFDPGDERVAGICEKGILFLCDLGGRTLGTWRSGNGGDAVTFSSDGTRLTVATEESVIQVRDPRQPAKTVQHRRLPHAVNAIVGCEDSDVALLVSDDGRTHQFWSTSTQQAIGSAQKHEDPVASARVFLKNRQPHAVLALKSGAVEVWNTKGERLAVRAADPRLKEGSEKDVPAAMVNRAIKILHLSMFGADGHDAVSSPGRVGFARLTLDMDRLRDLAEKAMKNGGSMDQFVKSMWDPKNGVLCGEIQVLDELDLHVLEQMPTSFGLASCKLSADGGVIAAMSASDNHLAVLRRGPGAASRSLLNAEPISKTGLYLIADYEISPDGRWLAAAGGFGAAVMDLNKTAPHWKLFAQGDRVTKAQFSPDSEKLALDVSPTDSKGVAQIWDVASATPLSSLLEHEKNMGGMTFTPDSRLLITWSEDGVVKVWDAAGGRAVALPWETGSGITNAAVFNQGTALMFANHDRNLWCAALPPSQTASSWAPDFLEGLGRGRLDASGKFLPVPLAQAVSLSPSLQPADAEKTGPWKDLAQCLANARDPRVPGLAVAQTDEELRDIERIFKDGDHTSAYMILRELLRGHPALPVPESLSQLARFVHHRRDEIFVDEAEKGRRAGETMAGPAGLRFRWCPPGAFMMGSPATEKGRHDDETPHRVIVSRGFWMAETEITQAQWERVMGNTALNHAKKRLAEAATFPYGKNHGPVTSLEWHELSKPDDLDSWTSWFGPDKPMMCVTHDDAVDFANRVNSLMPRVKTLGYWTGSGACRLPTEAEWEYACRAGSSTATYAGDPEYPESGIDPLLSSIAWYSGNSTEGVTVTGLDSNTSTDSERPRPTVAIHAVGGKKPNPWGLYDMLGNVNEWCLDNYRREQIDGEVNPYVGIRGANRVCRGQDITGQATSLRAARRASYPDNWRCVSLGFRVILVDHEIVQSPAQ